MKLTYNDAFSTINNKGSVGRHVWNCSQIDVLNNGLEVFMLWIVATELEFCLQRHCIG